MKYKGILIDSISIFSTTAIYLELVVLIIQDLLKWIKKFIVKRRVTLLIAALVWLLIVYLPALHVLISLGRLFNKYAIS